VNVIVHEDELDIKLRYYTKSITGWQQWALRAQNMDVNYVYFMPSAVAIQLYL